MLNQIRKLKKSRDGQSIVLAAIGVLVLAISVMATVNLGHAIHERIRLQNTADATAYSLAALEARAFNFFAFTNRAQVSHYVTLMSLQSWLALIWFIDYLLGSMADLVSEIQFGACLCCRFCIIPPIVAIACTVEGLAATAHNILRQAHNVVRRLADGADRLIGNAIYYLAEVNRFGVYATQTLMRGMVSANVLLSGKDFAIANDPKLGFEVWDFLTGAYNVLEFDGTIDDSAGLTNLPNPDATGDTLGAMRMMSEITNATRYPDFITNRSIDNVLSSIPGIGPLLRYLPITIGPEGQTKMTTVVEKCGMNQSCRCKKRFGTQIDHSQLPKGNVIAADMILSININLPFMDDISFDLGPDYVSVWASANNDGEHCAHDNIDIPTFICQTFYITWPKCYGDTNNHRWKGIMPYMKFKPDSEHATFKQPSTLIALNKKPEELGGEVYKQHFTFSNGPRSEDLDTTIGDDSLLPAGFEGLNAWSRGMAYYHRPSFRDGSSNWREHPNFFNPFWRAKLAPLGEKAEELLSKVPFAGQIGSEVLKQILTH